MSVETEGSVAAQGIGGAIATTALACHMSDCSGIFPPEPPHIVQASADAEFMQDPVIVSPSTTTETIASTQAATQGEVGATLGTESGVLESTAPTPDLIIQQGVAGTQAGIGTVLGAEVSGFDMFLGLAADVGIAGAMG